MIKFPRVLQQIHTFQKEDVWYVANIKMGKVLQVDALTIDILSLCTTCDNAKILEKLGDKYTEGQILESLKALSGETELLLFQPERKQVASPTTTQDRLRLFIPHGFMRYKQVLSPMTNVAIHNLLITLAEHAEVFVEIDNDSSTIKQREQLETRGIRFVSDIFESTNAPIYASNRFVVEDCNGILALSPHPYEELNYFRHNMIPVVSRIYSDRNLRESALNKLLSHYSILRSFDSVCADTPWIASELAVLGSFGTEGMETIPNGIDTQIYVPQDSQQARDAVASIVEEKSVLNAPIVGVINGFHPQNSIGMIGELARLHKDVVFIVFDQVLSPNRTHSHHNVFYINLQHPEDTIALPWIYSACEFIIFPMVIGTPFSMVLEALACEVPGIALTSTKLSGELAKCLISVPLAQNNTTGKFIIPTDAISQQIDTLLGESEMLETLSIKARQIAENYSWEKTAHRFLELFAQLNEKKSENITPKYPDVAFAPYYDRAQNRVRVGATQLDGLFKHSVEEGLVQTLLAEHTLEEVRTVLRYLLQDTEKADKLISTLLP